MAIRTSTVPPFRRLPDSLPEDGAVSIALQEGVPVFRAAASVSARIEALLYKQREAGLTPLESEELDGYEEVDDYLSFVNRTLRDILLADRKAS